MPWDSSSAKKHKAGLSGESSDKWAAIANAVLAQTGNESLAIRTASAKTGPSKGAIKRRLKRVKGD
jgi:hypothetical protein